MTMMKLIVVDEADVRGNVAGCEASSSIALRSELTSWMDELLGNAISPSGLEVGSSRTVLRLICTEYEVSDATMATSSQQATAPFHLRRTPTFPRTLRPQVTTIRF